MVLPGSSKYRIIRAPCICPNASRSSLTDGLTYSDCSADPRVVQYNNLINNTYMYVCSLGVLKSLLWGCGTGIKYKKKTVLWLNLMSNCFFCQCPFLTFDTNELKHCYIKPYSKFFLESWWYEKISRLAESKKNEISRPKYALIVRIKRNWFIKKTLFTLKIHWKRYIKFR